jgi:hypothetical protein
LENSVGELNSLTINCVWNHRDSTSFGFEYSENIHKRFSLQDSEFRRGDNRSVLLVGAAMTHLTQLITPVALANFFTIFKIKI